MRLIFICTILPFTAFGQQIATQLHTTKYGGTFGYANSTSHATGTILIYPETDSTVLFHIDINKGAPSYNMGSLYGRIKLTKGQGTYESKSLTCQWTIQFSKDQLTVETIKNSYDCGFGFGVIADGVFKQSSKKIPDHFVDGEGTKYFFAKTTPERYYDN